MNAKDLMFRNVDEFVAWLESLHECDASGAVGAGKFEPAQVAAKAVREAFPA